MGLYSTMSATTESCPQSMVIALFRALEDRALRYALMRNFEAFPAFGHDIDLLMHPADRARFADILIGLAPSLGWNALTYCDHWAHSPLGVHQIHIYRLFCYNPRAYLQIDLFQGIPVHGLPWLDVDFLLARRQRHATHGFSHLDPLSEHMVHLLQIHKIAGLPHTADKIERYRRKVLACHQADPAALEAHLATCLSARAIPALAALAAHDIPRACRAIAAAKQDYLIRYGLRHPMKSIQAVWHRGFDYARLFGTRPCGFVLPVDVTQSKNGIRCVRDALSQLKQANFIIAFDTEGWQQAGRSWPERRVLERGGIVIKQATTQPDRLIITATDTPETLVPKLMERLIDRHPQLPLGGS